mmetsp:Transcript_8306/g.23631  ORF Transcript_8306/g.23631 Transcript_8306/m.23631 type:complete len:101 (-) Transcript_8306:22-324(-)
MKWMNSFPPSLSVCVVCRFPPVFLSCGWEEEREKYGMGALMGETLGLFGLLWCASSVGVLALSWSSATIHIECYLHSLCAVAVERLTDRHHTLITCTQRK